MTSQIELKALTMLRSAELTQNMETEHLRKLAATAGEAEFSEGEIIYHKGQAGQAVYLIETGQIVIETDVPDQGRVIMNTLGPGQFFGWSALFPTERKMAWTRATQPTKTIVFNAKQLQTAWQTDHKLEYAVIRRAGRDMIERIKAIRQQLINILPADD